MLVTDAEDTAPTMVSSSSPVQAGLRVFPVIGKLRLTPGGAGASEGGGWSLWAVASQGPRGVWALQGWEPGALWYQVTPGGASCSWRLLPPHPTGPPEAPRRVLASACG